MAPYGPMRFSHLCITALCVAAATACGASSSSSPAASSNNSGSSSAPTQSGNSGGGTPAPCTLITQAQAATALGKPVDPGKPSDTAVVQSCGWFETGEGSDYVGITYTQQQSFDDAKALNGQGTTIQPAGGVGDDAFYMVNGSNALLEVRQGTVYITVDVEIRGNSDQAAEKIVAVEALANLH